MAGCIGRGDNLVDVSHLAGYGGKSDTGADREDFVLPDKAISGCQAADVFGHLARALGMRGQKREVGQHPLFVLKRVATVASCFDRFRALSDDARVAWLGFVIGRTLEASLNMLGERNIALHDHLGCLIGIDMAAWWRPTAANYFDRVPKAVILDALSDVGGPDLASRFASVKKGDLAMSAERVFAGTYITEVEVREKALAWVPEVMRFASTTLEAGEAELDATDAESGVDGEIHTPRELAA